jgi:hypothetical protein
LYIQTRINSHCRLEKEDETFKLYGVADIPQEIKNFEQLREAFYHPLATNVYVYCLQNSEGEKKVLAVLSSNNVITSEEIGRRYAFIWSENKKRSRVTNVFKGGSSSSWP